MLNQASWVMALSVRAGCVGFFSGFVRCGESRASPGGLTARRRRRGGASEVLPGEEPGEGYDRCVKRTGCHNDGEEAERGRNESKERGIEWIAPWGGGVEIVCLKWYPAMRKLASMMKNGSRRT